MRLQKFILATIISTLFSAPIYANDSAQSSEGSAGGVQFDINGEIKDVTCEVDSAYKNLVVILPTVGTKQLAQAGAKAGRTPFQINIGNCQNMEDDYREGKNILAFFESEHLDTQNNYTLKNAAQTAGSYQAATNVNIQLIDNENNAILISNNEAEKNSTFKPLESYKSGELFSTQKENYSLHYAAQYYATGVASSGLVESFATFTIRYK